MQYTLGALRSPPDGRDFPAAAFLPATPPPMPIIVDLRQHMQPVRNQGGKGTCVCFATASGAMGYKEGAAGVVLSPDDLYDEARVLMPVPDGAQGSYPRAALMAMAKSGVCLESLRPYTEGTAPPATPQAIANRRHNMIDTYASAALTVEEIKSSIYHYGPGVITLAVDDGFFNPGAGGVITPGGALHGGHGVCICGWKPGYWLIRNSWGTTYGDGGYAWLPWTVPLWEAWFATGALVDGKPPLPPEQPWWVRFLPWLHQ